MKTIDARSATESGIAAATAGAKESNTAPVDVTETVEENRRQIAEMADGQIDLTTEAMRGALDYETGPIFDAWLAAVIARAKREERERIAAELGEMRQLRARQIAHDQMDRDRGESYAYRTAERIATEGRNA